MWMKPPALLTIVAMTLAIVGGWLAGRTIAAQVSQVSNQGTSQQQTVSSAQTGTTEYRMLSGSINSIVKVTGTDAKGRPVTNAGPYLEEEINKLAAQGFVVESFQVASTTFGSGASTYFAISGSSQILVLLKRIKN